MPSSRTHAAREPALRDLSALLTSTTLIAGFCPPLMLPSAFGLDGLPGVARSAGPNFDHMSLTSTRSLRIRREHLDQPGRFATHRLRLLLDVTLLLVIERETQPSSSDFAARLVLSVQASLIALSCATPRSLSIP